MLIVHLLDLRLDLTSRPAARDSTRTRAFSDSRLDSTLCDSRTSLSNQMKSTVHVTYDAQVFGGDLHVDLRRRLRLESSLLHRGRVFHDPSAQIAVLLRSGVNTLNGGTSTSL